MARDFNTTHKVANTLAAQPIDTTVTAAMQNPGLYVWGPPHARRARTYSQVIAATTNGGIDSSANLHNGGQPGPNGPKVEDRQAPDWRGHYLGKGIFDPFAKARDDGGDALAIEEDEAGEHGFRTVAKVANIDEELGVVFGWAIVCTEKGQPYYDLNIDWEGQYAGERVPEHIPEPTMLKACLEFMETDERAGNEMHAGPELGKFVCAFPLTAEIAKAMGISSDKTGLMVGYKPPEAVLAKFKSGEYTGFSIEGWRTDCEEHD